MTFPRPLKFLVSNPGAWILSDCWPWRSHTIYEVLILILTAAKNWLVVPSCCRCCTLWLQDTERSCCNWCGCKPFSGYLPKLWVLLYRLLGDGFYQWPYLAVECVLYYKISGHTYPLVQAWNNYVGSINYFSIGCKTCSTEENPCLDLVP